MKLIPNARIQKIRKQRFDRYRAVLAGMLILAPVGSWSQPPRPPQLLLQRRYTGEESKTPVGHVATALLGRDSLVYVLDPTNSVIHVAKGSTQVRLISRKGRGPGEMLQPGRMAFYGDSIALPDWPLMRVTLFALKARTVRTQDVAPTRVSGFDIVSAIAFGRSALVMAGHNAGGLPEPGKTNDIALFLRRHGATALDTLARLTRPNIGISLPVLFRGEPTTTPKEQPFVITPTWDFAREGGGVVVLDTAGSTSTTVTVRMRQWSNDGRLQRTCTIARTRRPMTNDAFNAGVESLGPPPSGRDVVKVDWAAARRLVVRTTSLPPFRGVRLASDGTVWIRTDASFVSQNEEYLVLPSTGCLSPRSVILPLDWTVEDARGPLFIVSGYVNDAPAIDTWRY